MQSEHAFAADERVAAAGFLRHPDEHTFSSLCHALTPQLLRYFLARGCDRALAEELTQDVLFAVYRNVAQLHCYESFFGWLFKIARNALTLHWRKSRRQVETVQLESTELASTAKSAFEDPWLRKWFAGLEGDERVIMSLRYFEGLEYHEIAESLEMPIGTVKWKIFDAKRRLAVMLGGGRERKSDETIVSRTCGR